MSEIKKTSFAVNIIENTLKASELFNRTVDSINEISAALRHLALAVKSVTQIVEIHDRVLYEIIKSLNGNTEMFEKDQNKSFDAASLISLIRSQDKKTSN